MKKTLLIALIALLGFAFAGARAPAASADTAAVRVNTKDDSSLFRFAFGIRRVMNGVVDQTNAAVAYARCERCRTVAISIQIVLVMSPATVVTPQNVAIAINEQCTLCETLAAAYQFVIGTPGPVRFTEEGKREIAEIRQQLKALRDNGNLTLEEIQQRIDALVARLRIVLATQLVPLGPGEEPEADEGEEEETEGGLEKKPERPKTAATETTETTTETVPTPTETHSVETTATPEPTEPTETPTTTTP
jgi:putative peptide zinc metalloprotease protein